MRFNPLSLICPAIAAGIGFLINGVTGAVWGAVIMASVALVVTLIEL